MNCPQCGTTKMRITESFSTPEICYRTRKCRDDNCGWRFTTHEKIADEVVIPKAARKRLHLKDKKQ